MLAKASHNTKSWQGPGIVLALLCVLLVACVVIINWRNDREAAQFGKSTATPQLLDEHMKTLLSALSRLESESALQEHDRAFFAACTAINEIGRLQFRAAPAVPLLVAVLGAPERQDSLGDVSLRLRAASALEAVGRPALEAVVGLLKHKDAQVRFLAAQAVYGWATGKTTISAGVPLSDLQIAVQPIKEALGCETDEMAEGALRFALYHVNREEAIKLGIRYPPIFEDSRTRKNE